ncbi:MAG: 4-hydroxy 2-oxovalerate aldolase [Myxococcota bacterium]|jgi:4-hydroxy 2-oxovalerate aldolase
MGLDYRVRCCPDGLITDRRRVVEVLDCTIRDGGCTNAWQFDDDLVRRTFGALCESGVDVMEIGYQTSPGVFEAGSVGPWRYCREEDLRRVVTPESLGGMRLSCMLDMGRIEAEDLRPAADSVIDVLRVATYAADIRQAIDLCEAAQDLGYEVHCNVMAVTRCTPAQVDEFLECLRNSRVPVVAVVDSFGAMYPHQLTYLIRKYKNWLRPDQRVGVHLHNNQQTAFANAIAAIDEGADLIDASVFGMGRGAGNVPLELLLMYLDDERHDVRPILGLVDDYMPLRAQLKWGYQVPYAITGWLNRHPNAAIERMQHASPESLGFYDTLTRDRPRRPHHRPHWEPK